MLLTNIHLSRRHGSSETALVKRYESLFSAFITFSVHFLQAKYGFVAFSDPEDFLKAWKEMDGKPLQ